MFKGVPEGVRQAVTAALPLFIAIILFLVVGKFGFSKVVEVRSKITAAQKIEKTLTEKLNILQALSGDVLLKSGSVTTAVPDTNPSLATISQLKQAAATGGVVITGIKSSVGTLDTGGLNEAIISFSLEGTKSQIFAFLAELANLSPITIADKIKFSELGGVMKADLSVKSYWAAFPKVIPSVTSPITDLTASEKTLLAKVSSLSQPVFIDIAPSTEVNPNPFGQ
jgi:ribosomal protein L30E